MQTPKVGSFVRVEVNNLSAMLKNPIFCDVIPKTIIYEGQVVALDKFDPKDSFNLTTGNHSFPIRNIAIRNVVNIEVIQQNDKQSSSVQTIEVVGTKGNKYTITIDRDKITCTCPVFQFKKQQCKHIKKFLGERVEQTIQETDSKQPAERKVFSSTTKLAQARKIFVAVGGRRDQFVREVQHNLQMSTASANTYFYKIRNQK